LNTAKPAARKRHRNADRADLEPSAFRRQAGRPDLAEFQPAVAGVSDKTQG
jgi:hypothetical protein